jgi:hypothetical protein
MGGFERTNENGTRGRLGYVVAVDAE